MAGFLLVTGCIFKEATEISISIDEHNYLFIKNNTGQSIAFNKPIRMQNEDYINLYDTKFNKENNFAVVYLLNNNGEKKYACGSLHYWGKQTEVIIPKGSIYKDDVFYGGPSIQELYCLEPGAYKMILEIGQVVNSGELHSSKIIYKSNYLDIIIE